MPPGNRLRTALHGPTPAATDKTGIVRGRRLRTPAGPATPPHWEPTPWTRPSLTDVGSAAPAINLAGAGARPARGAGPGSLPACGRREYFKPQFQEGQNVTA